VGLDIDGLENEYDGVQVEEIKEEKKVFLAYEITFVEM
jgi:hypothetical protein